MKRASYVLSILSVFFLVYSHSIGKAADLYPGEEMRIGDGYPSLVKFFKGDPAKPMVVFAPGAWHLGRISYGNPSSNEKDFLAHWLQQKGYPFAAISYPVDNPVYKGTYPEFSIRNWGRQGAEITKQLIDENKLSSHVILLGWSNGGKIPQSYNVAARRLGITVDFYVSLSATTPLPGQIPGGFKLVKPSEKGLARLGVLNRWFTTLIKEQNELNGHTIIPEDIYLKEFIGDFPVGLLGAAVRYRDGLWVHDEAEGFRDSGVFRFAEFPLVTLVLADYPSEGRHALTDKGAWGLFIAQKIYLGYVVGNKVNVSKLAPEKWQELIEVTQEAPDRLTTTVHGNHLFFIGEKGASRLADNIEQLESKVKELKAEIGDLIGVELK
jgi:hypothetical protein